MERYPESEEHDRGFSRNRDYGRGYRGRSQHRDYDPEHAGFDRAGDRARARTGRMEDVPDGRWQHQPDSNRPEDYEWSRAGQPGQHYEGSYERSRSGPARTGYQRDDFDVHSYGRYQGRHQGGSGLGQVRGTAGGDREEASSGYGRAAMVPAATMPAVTTSGTGTHSPANLTRPTAGATTTGVTVSRAAATTTWTSVPVRRVQVILRCTARTWGEDLKATSARRTASARTSVSC